MSFRPKLFDSGKVRSLPLAASVVATKHSLLKFSLGYLTNAAAGDDEVGYLALQTVTGGATDGSVSCLVIPCDDAVVFVALTGTTPVQATHVGNDYDLGSAAALDLTATTDKVFHIDRIINAADLLVEGRFNKPAIA